LILLSLYANNSTKVLLTQLDAQTLKLRSEPEDSHIRMASLKGIF